MIVVTAVACADAAVTASAVAHQWSLHWYLQLRLVSSAGHERRMKNFVNVAAAAAAVVANWKETDYCLDSASARQVAAEFHEDEGDE